MARVLIACEFSGIVRDAFIRCGHDAISCDILPTERLGPHIVGDVRGLLHEAWDLLIAFPPCTYLARSGARWWGTRREEQAEAVQFVWEIATAPVRKIAIENPVGILSTVWRKPDQIIQPWQFGHGETKATCFWLKGLRPLESTYLVTGREARVYRASPGPDRWKVRSRTLLGVAEAMAKQWGGECKKPLTQPPSMR